MRNRRVVITGLGAVAPNGIGKEAFWQALIEGRSGIGRITRFDPSKYSSQVAGEVKDFDPLKYMSRKEAEGMGRATQFAVAAARMALDDAGLDDIRDSRWRRGVVVGHESLVMDVAEEQFGVFKKEGDDPTCIPRSTLWKYTPNAPATAASLLLGSGDSLITLSNNCIAGLNAIGYAAGQIREGWLDLAVAGGTSVCLTPYLFGCFCAYGVLTSNPDPATASRPFDRRREGVVYAEGAGMVILESLEVARERKAPIYGEVLGFSEGNRTCMRENAGWAEAIRLALERARLRPRDIDYICAHGVSHPTLDLWETLAIKEAFGEHAYRVPISSIKSMIGQPGAAAGSLQVIATAMAIRAGRIPPTMNYEHPDPRCDLDYVPNESRRNPIDAVLIVSGGGAGMESCLVIQGV